MNALDEIIRQIVGHIRSAWRYRWHGLAASWFLCVVGWIMVLAMPNQYEASARVYVDTETTLRPLLEGLAVRTDVMNQVNLMTRALLSRPQLEQLARKTDLDLRAHSDAAMEQLLEVLERSIRIESGGGENLFRIAFSDSDREMAQRVVDTMLASFVNDTLGLNRSDARAAEEFLTEQIQEYETRLQEAEQRLADFKKANVGLMPDSRGDYFSRLQQSEAAMDETRYLLNQARVTRDELQKQLVGEEPVFGLVSAPEMLTSAYSERIRQYEKTLDSLLVKFTDKHPDVVAVREIIDDLKKQEQAELQEMMESRMATGSSAAASVKENPVYQSMRIAMSEAEVQVATLTTRLADQRRQVNELRRLVDKVPEVEANLAQLNRDYEVTRQSYQELLSRLESARLSDNAEQSRDSMKFRILDPPFAPLEPVSPNRPLMLSAVLVAGLGLGVVMALFLAHLKPVFTDTYDLEVTTNLPVIGSVSLFDESNQQLKRWSNFGLGASYALLIMVYVGSMLLQEPGAELLAGMLS